MVELEVLFLPFFITVIVIDAVFPFVVFAVILVVPGDLANTCPVVTPTDATFVSEDVHVTTVALLSGITVAFKFIVS